VQTHGVYPDLAVVWRGSLELFCRALLGRTSPALLDLPDSHRSSGFAPRHKPRCAAVLGTVVVREPHTDFIVARAANPAGGEKVEPYNHVRWRTPVGSEQQPDRTMHGLQSSWVDLACTPEKENEPIYSAGNGGCN